MMVAKQPPYTMVLKIKADVRARDGHKCRHCGIINEEHKKLTGKILEVHRIIPSSTYAVDGCMTLCRKCHMRMPKGKRDGLSLFVKLNHEIRSQLDKLVEMNASSLQSETRVAIREHLQGLNLWPIDRTRRG